MLPHPNGRARFALGLSIAAFALPALTSLALLIFRGSSLLEPPGRLLTTSGGESISIYNIMKAQRGLVLYEDPREPPNYPTTLYNAGFYQTYAVMTAAFRDDTDRLVLAIRLLTLVLACVGLSGLLVYTWMSLKREPSGRPSALVASVMTLAAISATLGAVPGWWLLTARPDVGAVAFCAVGLALALGVRPGREWSIGLSAGVCFAVAWSFKQSCVFLLAGLCLSAIIQRRGRFLVALALPVVAVGVGFAACLGPEYRYNAFFATALSAFELRNLAHLTTRLALKGAFPITAAVFALFLLPRAHWLREDERTSLVACWWTSLIGGMVTCCRNGSELNYFFELWVVVGFLAVTLARVMISPPTPRSNLPDGVPSRLAIVALFCVSLVSAGADTACLLGGGRFGNARLVMTGEELTELENAKALAIQADGAVFCQPALTGLAWDLPFPAYVYDDYPYFHAPALRKGLLHGKGLSGLIAGHHFQVLILQRDSLPLLDAAVDAGYVRQPRWTQFAVYTAPASTPLPQSGDRHEATNHPPELDRDIGKTLCVW